MTLNIFDLSIGGKVSGSKISEGTITLVNDQYTIITGLSVVRGHSVHPIGLRGDNSIALITATTAGGMLVSLTNSIGTAIATVATCTCIFTGY